VARLDDPAAQSALGAAPAYSPSRANHRSSVRPGESWARTGHHTILADDKAFVDPQKDPYPEVFKALNLVDLKYEFHLPVKSDAFLPSTLRALLKVEFFDGKQDQERNQAVIAALSFRIRYTSIYEEGENPLTGNGAFDGRSRHSNNRLSSKIVKSE
jgi:hypothetical protein